MGIVVELGFYDTCCSGFLPSTVKELEETIKGVAVDTFKKQGLDAQIDQFQIGDVPYNFRWADEDDDKNSSAGSHLGAGDLLGRDQDLSDALLEETPRSETEADPTQAGGGAHAGATPPSEATPITINNRSGEGYGGVQV